MFGSLGDTLRSTSSPEYQPLELELAARNHAAYSELLAIETTPISGHYVLIHFDVPIIDPDTWRLRTEGLIDRPLELGLADLRAMPSVTRAVTLECAGNGRTLMSPRMVVQPWRTDGVSTAVWKGVRLCDVLSSTGIQKSVRNIVFEGRDRGIVAKIEHNYARSLEVEEAMNPDMLLAYEMNGQPLPISHGYPLRLLCPGWYGMASVKWLEKIIAIPDEFDGPQQTIYYRYTSRPDEAGEPVTRMKPRSLIAPPGIPDENRQRYVAMGSIPIVGKAWSGFAPVTRVEVSVDGGRTWRDAELDPPRYSYTWQAFRFEWDAQPGVHRLRSRATDEAGNIQPTTPEWNLQGLGNNVVSHIDVVVGSSRMESKEFSTTRRAR